jgi:hypothetical protein
MRPASPVLIAGLTLLAGCSSQQDKELAAVKSAQSILAEWATLNEAASNGRLNGLYAAQMRSMAREQLKTDRASIKDPKAAEAIDGVLRMDDRYATNFTFQQMKLFEAEKQLEAR